MTPSEKLFEIKEEISELIEQAEEIVRKHGQERGIYDRAKAYWIGHIKMSLSKDYGYGSMCTMEDTVYSLENNDEEIDDPELDDDEEDDDIEE